jgi:hypothetical protein
MATNMDKALYQAPMGLDAMEGPPVEIEIEDPESVHIDLGDIEIDLEAGKDTEDNFDANLADFMDDSELSSLGSDLV